MDSAIRNQVRDLLNHQIAPSFRGGPQTADLP